MERPDEKISFLAPGAPTAEEVTKLLQRKDQIEAQLANLEKQIYNLETSYLEDTYNVGTALKGWDALTGRSSGSGAISARRKLRDEDRIFSLSSATSMRNMEPADMARQPTTPGDKSKGRKNKGTPGSNNKQRAPPSAGGRKKSRVEEDELSS